MLCAETADYGYPNSVLKESSMYTQVIDRKRHEATNKSLAVAFADSYSLGLIDRLGLVAHHTLESHTHKRESNGLWIAHHPIYNGDLDLEDERFSHLAFMGSNLDNFSYTLGPSSLENINYELWSRVADPYERLCQKSRLGRTNMEFGDTHMHSPSVYYGHASPNSDLPPGFGVPSMESGYGLFPRTDARNQYSYCPGEWNRSEGSEGPYPRRSSFMGNPYMPFHEHVDFARPFLGCDQTRSTQLPSHNADFSSFASNHNSRSTTTPSTISNSIGDPLASSMVGPKSTAYALPDFLSQVASVSGQDSTAEERKISLSTAMQSFPTGPSHVRVNWAQGDGLTARLRGPTKRFPSTVPNLSHRPTVLLRQHTGCKKDFTYAPEYIRAALSELLNIVMKSAFVSQNVLEPTIGSDVGEAILFEVYEKTGVWLGDKVREGESIYFLFIDQTLNRSWICGHFNRTSGRALGHVRSALNHRPFHCLGTTHGCHSKKCRDARPLRFFTEALRDDHSRRQDLKDECTTCGTVIRRGGMNRHVRDIHPETLSILVSGEEGSAEGIS